MLLSGVRVAGLVSCPSEAKGGPGLGSLVRLTTLTTPLALGYEVVGGLCISSHAPMEGQQNKPQGLGGLLFRDPNQALQVGKPQNVLSAQVPL